MPRPDRLSHQEKMIMRMKGLQDLDQGDAQLAALFQQLGQDRELQPHRVKEAELRNKGMEMDQKMAPEMMQMQRLGSVLRGAGDLSQGLYSNPQLSEDIITQILGRFGMYTPDPEAGEKRAAAQQGLSLDEFRALKEKFTKQPKK